MYLRQLSFIIPYVTGLIMRTKFGGVRGYYAWKSESQKTKYIEAYQKYS